MAIDDADNPASRQLEGDTGDRPGPDESADRVAVGQYTWDDYLREYGFAEEADRLYERFDAAPGGDRWSEGTQTLTDEDWDRAGLDPADFLGFHPDELPGRFATIAAAATELESRSELIGYDETPVVKDIYGWRDYRREEVAEGETFEPAEDLGFDPDDLGEVVSGLADRAEELEEVLEERTVDIAEGLDEDAFFSDEHGRTTVVNRYDLEKAVPMVKKQHFREEERYWVNKPYAFVIIFHSRKENEEKYYVIEPYRNEIETNLIEYVTGKLRSSIKYADEGSVAADEDHRREVIEERTYELLERYDLYERETGTGLGNKLADRLDIEKNGGMAGQVLDLLGYEEIEEVGDMDGIAARPEPAVVENDPETLTQYQVEKLLYYLKRDFIGYERIDGIKHDINVEDISCDGYDSPVFVYHSDYEQIITNIYHGESELDDFVVKLAQRSGKGISKRQPQVDATLPDGSRAQLTLGKEVSDHGTNYTIRQFQEVPHTPIDLINWNTFSLDEMAFLWLCIENNKSLIFAGGTASGKTTSLNAVSLFIPSNSKIVSIEDTREVELPQRNWIASVTRPSFTDDDKGDVDEFDLLEAALRQRPDYIVMGEIRGEEGRTLFQVMSTGHTTYTTFHADSVGEVLKRFTTDPINVSKTMFTALDLVSIQTATRVQGHKVRRNKVLTEINHYDPENDEINVRDVYQWQAETDEFLKMGASNTLEEVMFDRGWDRERLDEELLQRRAVLAYLIVNGLNTYTQVAATLQAFINDPETILGLIANEGLESSLEDLREMESVLIDVDPETEAMVPRPSPSDALLEEARDVLEQAEYIFERFRGEDPDDVIDALGGVAAETDVEVQTGAESDLSLEAGSASVTGDETPGPGAEPEPESAAAALENAYEGEPELGAGDDAPELDGDVADESSELEEDDTPALPGDEEGDDDGDDEFTEDEELDIDNWGFGEVEGDGEA